MDRRNVDSNPDTVKLWDCFVSNASQLAITLGSAPGLPVWIRLRVVAMGRPGLPPHTSLAVRFRLDAHPFVDGVPKLLLASEVALGGLDGDVPKQEVDLIRVYLR